MFEKFDENRYFAKSKFLEICEKIEIYRNCDQNRNFSKISLKPKIFEIFEIFRKFDLTKIETFRNLRKNRNFSKILTKFEILRKFD